MYESAYRLQIRAKRGSKEALNELNKRKKLIQQTGLTGVNNEAICIVLCDEILSKISYIDSAVLNIDSSKSVLRQQIIIEAFMSAAIEGARTTISEVIKDMNRHGAGVMTKSNQMVVNTVKACNLAYTNSITMDNIRDIWEVITDKVCENETVKGTKFRSGMVYIGNNTKISHVPCEASKIESKMQEMFNWLNSSKMNVLLKSCILHFYTVYIHPFCDGNGRLARLLNTSYLIHNGYGNIKYVSLSESINNDLAMYYKTLEESEYKYNNILDITPFIDYMLDRICDSIDETVSKYNVLSDVQLKLLNKLKSNGKNSEITVEKACKITKLDSVKTRNILNKLVDMHYLSKYRQGKRNIYRLN